MEGRLFSYTHHDGRMLAFVELECQTDFAARTIEFKMFGERLAMQLAQFQQTGCPSGPVFLESQWLFDTNSDETTEQRFKRFEETLGEKLCIRRFNLLIFGEQ